MIGSRIGHYEITAEIGRGGMGEVYRARDTKLNRDVALKILPQVFAQDSERMARFEREAQVLASLNHANIAQIYGIEEDLGPGAWGLGQKDDGATEWAGYRESGLQPPVSDPSPKTQHPKPTLGTKCLVLELVEGETLQEQIARGPISVDEALKIALQICEGLEAAHEKGIIHRDLKPANIKITPEGQVKILDFGLAKALEGETPVSDLSHSPTLTHQSTQAGVILGTAAYMSPEQARGKPVDKRTDIWAFGCVLYEMLTGRKAFGGDSTDETVSDVLASVLKGEPAWDQVPASTPLSIHRQIRRCLEKDARDRLHDVGDARIVIRETLIQKGERSAEMEQQSRAGWLWAGVLGLALLAFGFLLGYWVTPDEGLSSQRTRRFEIVSSDAVLDYWLRRSLTVSPDGERIVTEHRSWIDQQFPLYQRSFSERQAVPIPGTENGYDPFFSPDGKWLGFFQEGQLKKISLDGGTPVRICDATNPFGASWGPDGTIVFNNLPGEGLWQVSDGGGEPQRLTKPDWKNGEWAHWNPYFLPDGKAVLFAVWLGESRCNLALLDLETTEYRTILENVLYAVYVHSGHLLYARPDGLYGVGFDLDEKEVRGQEVPVERDLLVNRFHARAHFDISRTGTLVCLAGKPWLNELVLLDLEGNETSVGFPPDAYQYPRFSPDGTRIAVNVFKGDSIETWLMERHSGRRFKLPSEGNNIVPNWHPGGERLSFWSDREGPAGQWKLFWQLGDDSSQPELLLDVRGEGLGWFGGQDWSPDGEVLVGAGRREYTEDINAGAELLYLRLKDSPKLSLLIEAQRKADIHGATFSPDGKWVAFATDEAGAVRATAQVYITRFPEGGRKWMVSKEGGVRPLWSPDGKRIYFLKDQKLWVVEIKTDPFEAGEPKAVIDLVDKRIWTGDNYTRPNWDLSPDGDYFVMTRSMEGWEPTHQLNVTTNFFEVLKERVPTE